MISFDPKRIKLLAFDCDGTLLNTIPDYVHCMNEALDDFGLPHITHEEARTFLGYGTDKFVRCSMRGKKTDQVDDFKKSYLEHYSHHFFVDTQIYPGVIEFLTVAKNAGYKLAVCSNKPDHILQNLVRSAFPTIRFDYVSGQRIQGVTKPNPYQLNEIFERFDLKPEEVAYFGDTEVDEQFAKNAFVQSLFIVTYGFREKSFLMKNTTPLAFFEYIEEARKLFGL